MSEKTKKVWRKVKNIVKDRAIIWVYCNTLMTTIFGFSKITILQAIILFFATDFFIVDYLCIIISDYEKWIKRFEKNKNEKMANVASVLLAIIFEIIWLAITVLLSIYSWNNILLQQ